MAADLAALPVRQYCSIKVSCLSVRISMGLVIPAPSYVGIDRTQLRPLWR